MKIVFMGTPEFAVAPLQKIYESEHEVVGVVTGPDKERGRGRKVAYTAVKKFALEKNLLLFQPTRFKDENFIEQLKKLDADLFIVVAFRILPKEVYTIPKLGSFNLHASLLPKFRGAAPIQWSLIKGEKETGVTTFLLDEKVDTGNIILQEKIPIDDEDDFGTLHDKLMILGVDVVLRTISQLSTVSYQLSNQDDSLASPAPKITKEICEIDWTKSASEIHNLVRGLSPYPGAFFKLNGKDYKVFKTRIVENEVKVESGKWKVLSGSNLKIYQTKKELYFKTGSDILQILELQLEGRKRMTAEEFLRGYSLVVEE